MFYYTYVLRSEKDTKLYIGFTNNLKRRIKEHMQGKNISTSKRLPVKLIYYEAHLSKEDAQRREKYFKTDKGKSSLKQIIRSTLQDFSKGRKISPKFWYTDPYNTFISA